jgi:hypothetical protein
LGRGGRVPAGLGYFAMPSYNTKYNFFFKKYSFNYYFYKLEFSYLLIFAIFKIVMCISTVAGATQESKAKANVDGWGGGGHGVSP